MAEDDCTGEVSSLYLILYRYIERKKKKDSCQDTTVYQKWESFVFFILPECV